jgi:hypothetical protein
MHKLARRIQRHARYQQGKIGYLLLWLVGVPVPVLLLIYLLRGCS